MSRVVMKGFILSALFLFSFCQKKALELKDPYIFIPPKDSDVTAAFLTIVNHTDQDEVLLKALCDIAEVVELHETYIEEGVAKMRPVEKFVIPKGGELQLKPGGYHIMLIKLKRSLNLGEKIPITLVFEKGSKNILAEVKERS